MKKVFVCSPLRGDYEKNITAAKTYSCFVAEFGHLPITPHIYFTQFLDDSVERDRALGMLMGIELLKMCDELWVFGPIISDGMSKEIKYWEEMGKKPQYINGE